MEEIENLIPFERETYVQMILDYMEKKRLEALQQNNIRNAYL